MDEPVALTTDELQSALSSEIDDAIDFNDEYLSPHRTAATLYYKGAPFGTEEEGRSKVVSPVVRDTVRATMPSLMEVFFGARRVMEFIPGPNTPKHYAEDATETVSFIFNRQNPGWDICWAAFKDALIRRSGWIKWWYDESLCVKAQSFTGVSEEQLIEMEQLTLEGETIEVLERTQVGEQPGEPVPVGVDPMGQPITQPGPPVPVFEYKVQLVSKYPHNKIRVAAVPPDEVLLDRYARSEVDARIVIHRTQKTRSDLIALGVPAELLEDSGGGEMLEGEQLTEVQARMPGGVMPGNLRPAAMTDDQELIWHYECFWRVDTDGDGISELRKVCAVGPGRKIYFNEPWDEIELAQLCPDPEPHVATGLSQADSTMDLQLIESHVTRDLLDSLKASIFPRTVYVEGQINVDDVLNTEIGAAIRARAPGMVQTLEVPFAGREAYPLLELLDQKKEARTGIGRAASGLDGKALQSTTPDAARQSMTAAQSQVKLIARIFAQGPLTRVMRGILRLLSKHQNRKMEVALTGRTLTVNPKDWDPNMEVAVDVGLLSVNTSEQIAVLSAQSMQQKEVLMTLGAENPLCTLKEFYNTQTRILTLSGVKDHHNYWTDPDQAMAEGKTLPEPKPTPEQVLAQAQIEIEKSKHELDALKAILEDDRERDKNEMDALLKAAEIQARYDVAVDVGSLKAMVERDRMDRKQSEAEFKSLIASRPKDAPPPVVNVHVPGQQPMRRVPVRDADGKVIEVREEPAQ